MTTFVIIICVLVLLFGTSILGWTFDLFSEIFSLIFEGIFKFFGCLVSIIITLFVVYVVLMLLASMF